MAEGCLSNCGSSETGGIYGVAGDSTGNEYHLIPWWGSYNYRARHPNGEVRSLISALAVQAAQNDHIGYSQSGRETFWQEVQKVGYKPSAIQTNCNADCSSSTACIVKCAGHLIDDEKLKSVSSGMTTMTERLVLLAAGFEISSGSYTSGTGAEPGDIFWNSGHTTIWTNGNPDSGSYSAGSSYVPDAYTVTNTRNDAIIREVSYLDNSLKPSIKETDLRFSVLNYTVFVGGIWKIFANKYGYNTVTPMDTGGDDFTDLGNVTPSNPNSVAKAIITFLMLKGLNYAASVGICANCYHESGYNPGAVGDNGSSFGLFQWHAGRGQNMKKYVGSNWSTNVTGQLNFLWKETSESYPNLLKRFQSEPNTLSGAKDTAKTWCIQWEVPSNRYIKAEERAITATNVWDTFVQLKK